MPKARFSGGCQRVNPSPLKGSTLDALGVQRAIAEGRSAVEMVNYTAKG